MEKRKKRWKNLAYEALFTGPAAAAFLFVVALPFVMSIYYSLTSWNGVSRSISFVGFKNFADLARDKNFLHSFAFTFRYAVAVVLGSNLLGFALALLLAKPGRGSTLFRSIFFVPYAMSNLILGFIWQFIFTKGFPLIGQQVPWPFFQWPWLGTERTGYLAMVIVAVWKYAGYLMIIYIAGLLSVPDDVVEAARVDGVNFWQKLIYIRLPLIMPSVTVCLFLAINWSFNVFDVNKSLTNGGPFNSTESVTLNLYFEAFTRNNYGYGIAKALVFFLVVALLSVVQTRLTSDREVDM